MTAIAVWTLVSLPGLAAAQQQGAEEARTRAQIVNMESALITAVRTGAGQLANQLRTANTDVDVRVETMLVGLPEVQGTRVKPYGMVFFVRVPSMNASVMWSAKTLVRNPPRGGIQTTGSQGGQAPPTQSAPKTPDVSAASLSIPSPGDVLTDPMAAYRTAVKEALVDAMLENGGTLRIAPTERLTVAARRDTPANPLDPSDHVRTVTFTVTGATLDDYHRDRITIQEARKLVVIDED